tara:strand:- start:184 stop:612 length:429 start_codon:yes stop_codon:yes gene_type:complete
MRSLVLGFCLLFSSSAYADDEVITLEAGEPAPFAGTLLSPSAAAKILATTESDLALCQINSERDLALQQAESTLAFKNKEAELVACHLRHTEMTKVYTEQIDFLEKRAVTPDWVKPVIFIGGVVVGVATVSLSAHILNQIEN